MKVQDFDRWNGQKKIINFDSVRRYFHPREIWFIRMGKNVGFEQDGKGEEFQRPVVILKKFNQETFLAVPLTSQKKNGKYYVRMPQIQEKDNWAIISQVRLFDARRLLKKVGTLPVKEVGLLKKIITDMISCDDF